MTVIISAALLFVALTHVDVSRNCGITSDQINTWFRAWPEKLGGPGGTFPSGPHKFHFLGGTRGTQYITKMGPFYFPWTVFRQLQ